MPGTIDLLLSSEASTADLSRHALAVRIVIGLVITGLAVTALYTGVLLAFSRPMIAVLLDQSTLSFARQAYILDSFDALVFRAAFGSIAFISIIGSAGLLFLRQLVR